MPIVKDLEAKRLLEEMERDTKWYLKNRKKLIELYDNEFVAILNESIVAHDVDFEKILCKLSSEIKAKQPMIKFICKEGIQLVL